MVNEAIILAGGFGKRLRSVINDIPKPMANINNKPFLEYLITKLSKQGINKIIFSVGYKYEIIQNYFGNIYNNISFIYAIEEEPLGTGGAIRNALNFVNNNDVFIVNGDTFFNINYINLFNFHKSKSSKLSIALKNISYTERYGSVEINQDNKIISFLEKAPKSNVLINGGIYLVNKFFIHSLETPKTFSFEKDFIEKYFDNYDFYGLPFDNYFIDIGIPEDYIKACKEFNKLLD